MNVLVFNCGSSSVKFRLMAVDSRGITDLAGGSAERIGTPAAQLICWRPDGQEFGIELPEPEHRAAIEAICHWLDGSGPEVTIDVIGHRIVHGGPKLSNAKIITEDVCREIKACTVWAPLHNPPALNGIRACQSRFRDTPQVGVFDTAFHGTLPEVAWRLPLPRGVADAWGLRRYGFHGISHQYVSVEARRMLGEPRTRRVISCHLGQGSSITAILDGKSIDTSMGLTPLGGLPMGTRSGDMDPSVLLFLQEESGMSASQIGAMLREESGFKGWTGRNDVRDIELAAEKGDAHAATALDAFAYAVAGYIGRYAMALGGLDALVFTGGIGEHDAAMRTRIVRQGAHLGIAIDERKNRRDDVDISATGVSVATLVIPCNEERAIARTAIGILQHGESAAFDA